VQQSVISPRQRLEPIKAATLFDDATPQLPFEPGVHTA
jgi:hypothetical protein